tara:strand:- start:1358 stop:2293 length:936 start_codon:yes stop_codon:yes gene_type:complete
MNQGHTSGFYSIFKLTLALATILPLQGQDTTSVLDTTSVVIKNDTAIVYPGKALIMSLVLPGRGQLYNKEPLWKPGLFAGIELGSVLSIYYANKKADELRREYQEFADENWNLYNWWSFTKNGPNTDAQWVNDRHYAEEDFKAMRDFSGTHHLTIHLSGDLVNIFNTELISSDSLDMLSNYIGSDDISLVRDRHFYENIGKYDQFVGGWSDAASDWYWEEKDVGDSIEIVIKTPKKQDFLDQRYTANQWLSFAKYSVTALMFNHVISGLDAVWSPQRKTLREKDETETEVSLIFNPYNTSGIGGISLSLYF